MEEFSIFVVLCIEATTFKEVPFQLQIANLFIRRGWRERHTVSHHVCSSLHSRMAVPWSEYAQIKNVSIVRSWCWWGLQWQAFRVAKKVSKISQTAFTCMIGQIEISPFYDTSQSFNLSKNTNHFFHCWQFTFQSTTLAYDSSKKFGWKIVTTMEILKFCSVCHPINGYYHA